LAIELATQVGDPYSLHLAHALAASGLLVLGDAEGAVVLFERGLAVGERWGVQTLRRQTLPGLALAEHMRGREETAMELLGKLDFESVLSNRSARFARLRTLELLLRLGEADRASRFLNSIIERTGRPWGSQRDAALSCVEGDVRASASPPSLEAADRAYRHALDIAVPGGIRAVEARTRLGLGKVLARQGRVAEARQELTDSIALLRDIGMRYWLPEAERCLAELRV
jgi:tetratricopeptide (TPR) repeat protein